MVVKEATTASPLLAQVELEYQLEDADQMPRRIPMPAIRPSLNQCKPTDITLDENSRVIVALDKGGVGKALVKRLEKLDVTVLLLDATLTQEALETQLQTWLADGAIQGVYWLPALDVEPELTEMSLEAWHEANHIRVKSLSMTMRQLVEVVDEVGTFLLSATRLGGLHGYGPEPAVDPLGGGVTGFSKAYKRERPNVLVKAVDFEVSRKTAAFAELLIAETLHDPGCVEVGYWRDDRYTITLLEQPTDYNQSGIALNNETVFLVTGAAGGITSAIVADLAAASGGTFYLLDLTPVPDPDDPNIRRFREDREGLKQQFIDEMRAAGKKPLPPMIEKQLTAVERLDAALQAIEAVEGVGGTAVYRSVNLLDHDALLGIVDEIRQEYGRIDVLVHAGGIEISKGLADKDAAQFDLVYDIKADGFYSLLHAAQDLPIGATVSFSSVAGRFGNAGQTDYSAANDLLCKVTSNMQRTRPETQAIVIDWTAWGGIGMATRGSIPKIMEMAGIEMLPPEAGIPTTRRELVTGYAGELLVGGALGVLVDELDDGILTRRRGGAEGNVLIDAPVAAKVYGGWQVETTLDPKEQPFLYDHAMEGTPLLPGVMGTEAFAELAQMIAPDWHVTAVFAEDFHAPFKFYRMEAQTLYLSGTAVPDGDDLLVYTKLHSRREVRSGLQEKLHFTATVRMSKERAALVTLTPSPSPWEGEGSIRADAIYDIYFHGPAYQVLEGVQVDGNRAVGLLANDLPANIIPSDAKELIAPRLIELCFQTAGVWQIHTQSRMALPLAIGSVTAYQQECDANGRLYAIVEAVEDGAEFNAQVVDETGNLFVELQGYRTVTLPGKVNL